MNHTITLTTLVESALASVPGLAYKDGGSRADAAAEIVERHQIKHLGNLYSGSDYWQVGDHVCSIKAASCDCKDNHAPVVNGGRLCKHRLAAMFVVKLQKAASDRLERLMNEAPDGTLTIRVDVRYMDEGRQYRLLGHHYPGQPWEKYPYEECYPFNETLFDAVLRRCGWGLSSRPARQPGYAYNYFLERGANEGFRLGDMAAQDIDHKAQINRLREVKTTLGMESEMEITQ